MTVPWRKSYTSGVPEHCVVLVVLIVDSKSLDAMLDAILSTPAKLMVVSQSFWLDQVNGRSWIMKAFNEWHG